MSQAHTTVSRHWPLTLGMSLEYRPALSVLIFHRVLEHPDALRPNEPTVHTFEHRMRWVQAHFNVLPLTEACKALVEGRLPRKALCITFDDGYADNYTLAAPILKKLGLHATFFIATGYLDGGLMFNDALIEILRQRPDGMFDLSGLSLGQYVLDSEKARREAVSALLERVKYLPPAQRDQRVHEIACQANVALPVSLMMRGEEVLALHQMGMGIGAHTDMHPILSHVPIDAAEHEITLGRQKLEALIGEPVRTFAYPNGGPGKDYGPEHVELVRTLGFECAVTTAMGSARAGANPYQVPRFTPWDHTDGRYGLRLAQVRRRAQFAHV